MVNGKNVSFREKSMEKSPSPQRFEEPEGMTDIDLRRLSEMSGFSDSSVRKFDPRNVKNAMFKILAVFLFVGFVTMVFAVVFRKEPLQKHPRILNTSKNHPKQEFWNQRDKQAHNIPNLLKSIEYEDEILNHDDTNKEDRKNSNVNPTIENNFIDGYNELNVYKNMLDGKNNDYNVKDDNDLNNSILEFVSINLEKLQKCKFEQTVEACCINAKTNELNSTPCNVKSIVDEIKRREENFAKTQEHLLQRLSDNPLDLNTNANEAEIDGNTIENILNSENELKLNINNDHDNLFELPEMLLKLNEQHMFEDMLEPSENLFKSDPFLNPLDFIETQKLPEINNEFHIKSPHFNFDSYKIKLNDPNQLLQIPKNIENIISLSNNEQLFDPPSTEHENPFWILNPRKILTERNIKDDHFPEIENDEQPDQNSLAVTEQSIHARGDFEKLRKMGSELIRKFKEIGKSVGNEFHKIENKFNPTMNNLKSKIAATINSFGKQIEPRLKVITDFPKQVVTKTGSTLKKLQDKVIPETLSNGPEGFHINLNPFNRLNLYGRINKISSNDESANMNEKETYDNTEDISKESMVNENAVNEDTANKHHQNESDENIEGSESTEATAISILEINTEENLAGKTSSSMTTNKPTHVLARNLHKTGLMLQIIQKNQNSVSPIIINESGLRSIDADEQTEPIEESSMDNSIHSDYSVETTEFITTEPPLGPMKVSSKILNMEMPSIEKTDVSLELNETNVNVTYASPKIKRQAPNYYHPQHHHSIQHDRPQHRNHEHQNRFNHHGQFDYRGEEELGLRVHEGFRNAQNHRKSHLQPIQEAQMNQYAHAMPGHEQLGIANQQKHNYQPQENFQNPENAQPVYNHEASNNENAHNMHVTVMPGHEQLGIANRQNQNYQPQANFQNPENVQPVYHHEAPINQYAHNVHVTAMPGHEQFAISNQQHQNYQPQANFQTPKNVQPVYTGANYNGENIAVPIAQIDPQNYHSPQNIEQIHYGNDQNVVNVMNQNKNTEHNANFYLTGHNVNPPGNIYQQHDIERNEEQPKVQEFGEYINSPGYFNLGIPAPTEEIVDYNHPTTSVEQVKSINKEVLEAATESSIKINDNNFIGVQTTLADNLQNNRDEFTIQNTLVINPVETTLQNGIIEASTEVNKIVVGISNNDETNNYAEKRLNPNNKFMYPNYKITEDTRGAQANPRISTEAKIGHFNTAVENVQSSQHSSMNPNFAKQCIPISPPVGSPLPVIQQQMPFQYDPNVHFTQFIPVSIPKPQPNSFVINPLTYVTPNMPQTINGFGTFFPSSQAAPPPQMIQQPSVPNGQYYICNPIAAPNNQVSGIPGVEVRNAEEMVSAALNNMTTRQSERCPMGHELCADNSKCIKTERICDGEVNCDDGSDEVYCSCKYRLGESRWCDGYYDCPNGEDEIGCFGCEPGFFNCDDWSYSRGSTCIPINLRCNGVSDCPSGTDEEECSVLLETIQTSDDLFKVSNNAGFLHRNYEGKWYPVCSNPEYWALDACKYETGPSIIPPLTRVVPLEHPYSGSYANAGVDNAIHLVPNCLEKRAVYVECPQPTCGIRWVYNNPYRREEVDTSAEEIAARFSEKIRTSNNEFDEEDMRNETDNNVTMAEELTDNVMKDEVIKQNVTLKKRKAEQTKEEPITVGSGNRTEDLLGNGRVVGGRPCQPGAWPWVVSIYKNGAFHCGGVLITDRWLITAAHCTEKYWLYFYEIELGMLRRFSFSPMQQTRYVTDVIAHPGYDRKNLRNDLAMMRMNHPVKFNRYVRPICLPNEYTAGQYYQNGPTPGTVCTAVGWGATVEHGADPDHMREVEVPVLPVCKHKEDEEGNEICAGLMEGGKDACQGDSGGPFLCRNPNMPQQWYLAGIVSHGEGCARPNEPGVYTKVAIYRDWIYEYAKDDRLPQRKPLNHCPGYTCRSINKCIPKKRRCDRVIDCLYGDDEIDCERGNSFSSLFKHAMKNMMFSYDGLSRSNVERPGNPTVPDDTISTTTFKMENSPITDTPNGNGFAKDDSSFASPATISDRTEFISNAEAATATSVDVTTVDESPEESISPATVRNKEGAERPAKTDVNRTVMMKPFKGERFLCRKMLEVIPAEKKCDKTIDCQDGTDEESCACADYLKHSHPEAICDGVTDCADLSDEADCNSSCGHKHFYCRLSKVCIPIEKKCDNRPDCDYNEDEWDCFTLADSNRVVLDADSRPALLRSGLLAINQRNQWVPFCMNFTGIEGRIAADACVTMGFSDYEKFLQVEVPNKKLKIGKEEEILGDIEKSSPCSALYIKCADVSVSGHEIGEEDRLNVAGELHTPPWNAAVYADGEYKCAGTILNLNWILTSVNCFPGILKLHRHYVAVLTGAHKGYLHVGGPHEQTVRVTEAARVPDSEVVLLRLEKRFRFTRYVHPLHFQITGDFVRHKERCLIVGRDENNKSRMIYLRPYKNCSEGFRCFERLEESLSPECQVSDSFDPWSGCVVCDSGSGFYPAAVFHELRGRCGFSGNLTLPSITPLKRTMHDIMERSELLIQAPPCEGFRCNLGECIKAQSVCNGIPDCRDAADEEPAMCEDYRRECHLAGNCSCLPSEMRCNNGKCVEKSTFCDQIDDCGDESDEPETCNCRAYLRLANVSKICDGVRNCLDKSDEDPAICKCNPGQFKCGKSGVCIANDMVCDGQSNCPDNEDEERCYSLQSSDENHNIGEVFTCTYGIWHPGCFQERLTPTQLEDICKKIGFAGNSASYLNTTVSATGRPVLDAFSTFWVHRRTGSSKIRLSLRSGDRNFVEFVDDPECHRLFLRCL